jgi:hypothetical protein
MFIVLLMIGVTTPNKVFSTLNEPPLPGEHLKGKALVADILLIQNGPDLSVTIDGDCGNETIHVQGVFQNTTLPVTEADLIDVREIGLAGDYPFSLCFNMGGDIIINTVLSFDTDGDPGDPDAEPPIDPVPGTYVRAQVVMLSLVSQPNWPQE